MIEHCPRCGQPVVPDLDRLTLTPTQRRIYEAVRSRPRTGEQLYVMLYGHLPDPPLEKVVHVHISKLNDRLAPHGMRVVSERTWWGAYRIVPWPPDPGSPHARDRRHRINRMHEATPC